MKDMFLFMLLFFFMVTTVMRETNLKVTVIIPEATEVKKLEKKSLVSFIYIGKPHSNLQKTFGSEPRIQLNDAFATLGDIRDFVTSEREQMNENDIVFLRKPSGLPIQPDNGAFILSHPIRRCNTVPPPGEPSRST